MKTHRVPTARARPPWHRMSLARPLSALPPPLTALAAAHEQSRAAVPGQPACVSGPASLLPAPCADAQASQSSECTTCEHMQMPGAQPWIAGRSGTRCITSIYSTCHQYSACERALARARAGSCCTPAAVPGAPGRVPATPFRSKHICYSLQLQHFGPWSPRAARCRCAPKILAGVQISAHTQA